MGPLGKKGCAWDRGAKGCTCALGNLHLSASFSGLHLNTPTHRHVNLPLLQKASAMAGRHIKRAGGLQAEARLF